MAGALVVGGRSVLPGGGNDTICLGDGNDRGTASGDSKLFAGPGDDTILWSRGAVVAFGEAGNDVFRPGWYGIRGSGLTLDGGDGNDTMTGTHKGDTLNGGAGDDILCGGTAYSDGCVETIRDGADELYGGNDNDTLDGGAVIPAGTTPGDLASGDDGHDICRNVDRSNGCEA
ncbi:hypothetical protein OG453_02240 [Streptomyces sp. NBC_01381]|uniref:calcium-binding protein n=1 Tax=Streptomyces sp. NBC_01381 TaxID=2903845 RepID=UPI002252DDD9|nr:hypothetical protein [Streptomyces sp. NBC_01381]MCX4665502.1 hypothetical protein [Streptomyces sp. NBC_01381]